MAGQTYYTNVVCQIFATKLCAKTNFVRLVQQLLFKVNIAESAACFIARSGQVVVIFDRGQLHSEQVLFSTCTTNHKGNVVRRARSCTQTLHLLYQEGEQCALVLNGSLSHGVEIRFIGRATTLCHHYKAVFVALNGFDVNLCRQVATGVHLVVHVERSVL